jgi:hypothetical protein
MHELLDAEATEILALFDGWGETDRSHRKLAHRGSYLNRVWVSPSSVHRVLFLADKHFRPLPKPGRSQRKPFPEWVDNEPNSIWIYDSTHFTRAQMVVLIIQDLSHASGSLRSSPPKKLHPGPGRVHRRTRHRGTPGGRRATRRRARRPRRRRRQPAHPARGVRQRPPDDVRVDAGVHGHVRDRPALRAPRHPHRSGADRELAIEDPVTLRAELAVTREHWNACLRCEVVSAPTVHRRLPPPMRHRSGCAVSR